MTSNIHVLECTVSKLPFRHYCYHTAHSMPPLMPLKPLTMLSSSYRPKLKWILGAIRSFDACKRRAWLPSSLLQLMSVASSFVSTYILTFFDQSSVDTSTFSKKDRAGSVKSLLSFIQYFFPSQLRVFDLGPACASQRPHLSTILHQSECLRALRGLCEGRPVGSTVKWRDGRMWFVADASGTSVPSASLTWEGYSEEAHGVKGDSEPRGTLSVTGTIRGAPLSANRLVHIPNFGDFQIEKVCLRNIPF